MFIQDMLAQWTDNQTLYIPPNIPKGEMVTHVFDSIDYKDKNVQQTETHHRNLILMQKISLELKYDFNRKNPGFSNTNTKICLV